MGNKGCVAHDHVAAKSITVRDFALRGMAIQSLRGYKRIYKNNERFIKNPIDKVKLRYEKMEV
jgi:hypothetical protein